MSISLGQWHRMVQHYQAYFTNDTRSGKEIASGPDLGNIHQAHKRSTTKYDHEAAAYE